MTSEPLVLLQTSDWHVGSALTSRTLGLSPELRELRRDEVDGAAERAVAAARALNADGLVVPGDLWDAECVAPAVIHRLLAALASFGPRPVFIAPGNHDFAGPGGWYEPSVLAALGMRSWPENVLVFRGPAWSTLPFPGRDDAAVVGRAFLSARLAAERPLAQPPPVPAVPLSLLLLHGSYESYGGPDSPIGPKKTAPFSRKELLSTGFTWTALGHHHQLEIIEDDAGAPRAAYSGCPTGRGLDELGPRSFLKVTLHPDRPPEVETMPADARVVRDLALHVSELDGPEIQARAAALFDSVAVTSLDIVRLTLTGSQAYGARPAAAVTALAPRVAHLLVRDRTAPPSPAESAGLQTAEGRFVASLTARRETAEDKRVVDLALALGRDALAGRVVRPRNPEEW